jgi:hypothetical protein
LFDEFLSLPDNGGAVVVLFGPGDFLAHGCHLSSDEA